MKPQLTVTACTADLGGTWATPQAFAREIIHRTQSAWQAGADVVLWPEYLWLALERYCAWEEISALFWETLWPEILTSLANREKCVLLGTVPFLNDSELYNRAVIISEGQLHTQDKLCLTPWESAFTRGSGIQPWSFGGWRLAALICLDVELPEHSIAVRKLGIDLLLAPSATDNMLGVERVTRCASARAVECGCYVIVSPLVGECSSTLVDSNTGRLCCYTPSQAAFRKISRQDESEIYTAGWHHRTWQLDSRALEKTRRNKAETNPALIPH